MPGIDFTNDPLLQGRNFSYLDTQLKRLGGPNFTHLPVNAPKCPFHHFQQDGHMAMRQPDGPGQLRAELLGRRDGGPREVAENGFRSFPEESEGRRRASARRASPTTTARRGSSSSARPRSSRRTSRPPSTFELSKVETPAIRARMVSHLLNIDEALAKNVADGLRLKEMPKPADAATADTRGSAAVAGAQHPENGPESFAGRKLGVLVTDGVDAGC